MTNNVEQILQHLTHANPKLTYLVAIGETEQAQKAALTMLVEKMYSIYYNQYVYSKAEEMNKEIAILIKEKEEEARRISDKKAKSLLVESMQKYASDVVEEKTITVVNLDNDDMKGRIIGREGRNIRTIEAVTGVDLIIDDTPEAVVLSSFDPLRREIARVTLESLIKDGRIHPTRI